MVYADFKLQPCQSWLMNDSFMFSLVQIKWIFLLRSFDFESTPQRQCQKMVKNDCVVSTSCERVSITAIKYAKQLASICLWNTIFYRKQSTSFLKGWREEKRRGESRKFFKQVESKSVVTIDFVFFFSISSINAPNAHATKSNTMHYSAFQKQKKWNWIEYRTGF